ncbi:hypothetical protein [Legionella maioricensis]|uniref:Uncharacterized protein n=1 Tax=Legionella maioricensis TaxID=2896528 RepID=A0A9X2CZL6_9GAMM|nr:hypothetical protein [Legionella maioricensis]MCL9683609.1 hypothetical protein [Legionella maioricensis]MCL9687631.1 hypothetical protein [Legionella maioricensis]
MGIWKGLGLGHIVQVWLAYILSEGAHRLNHVESWAGSLLITLEKCLARPVWSLDFTDDRLAIVLGSLGYDDDFEAFESNLNQGIIRVYNLRTKHVRVTMSLVTCLHWNVAEMLGVGKKLFAKIHKQKYHAHHNHELHFMAREINDWLPQGIQSIVGFFSGRYGISQPP